MAYGTYQTRNPLARTNPLRSIPLLRPAPVKHTPMFLAAWELDLAAPAVATLEKQFAHARECLGRANQAHRLSRRRFQSQAMSFLNRTRAQLRAARKRLAAAEAAVAALQVQPVLVLAA